MLSKRCLLGWQIQLQKHKPHRSDKALFSFGFFFICSSGTTSLGGSVTGLFLCGHLTSSPKNTDHDVHEGTWL